MLGNVKEKKTKQIKTSFFFLLSATVHLGANEAQGIWFSAAKSSDVRTVKVRSPLAVDTVHEAVSGMPMRDQLTCSTGVT